MIIKFFIFLFVIFVMFLMFGVFILKRVKNAIFNTFSSNEKAQQEESINSEKEILYKSGNTVILKGEATDNNANHK
ncbi:MAG: hypothetical protein NTW25_12690 [Candidatus Kapabacteria bacterium]|nr:hypothetical protein [Candidatus Kapabacteria bacterium]